MIGRYLPVFTAVFAAACCAQEPVNRPMETLKARSRIVVVDVVATDSKGKAVKGLKASDFELQEDKQPQKIRHFDEHDAADPQLVKAAPQIKMPPNTFTNVVTAPMGSALNVILLDVLNTPQEAQPMLRYNLEKIANSLPANSRTAIFGLSDRVVMLQSFTSDPAVLKAILTQRRHMPATAALQKGANNGENASSNQLMRMSDGTMEAAPYLPDTAVAVFDRQVGLEMMNRSVRETIEALSQIGKYLAAMPGRKNLIWVSGGFPAAFIQDVDSAGSTVFQNTADYTDELKQVSSDLARAQVAVYPVDPRGVTTDTIFDASQVTRGRGAVINDPGYYNRGSSAQHSSEISEHAAMSNIAETTGGHAFWGSNDVGKQILTAMDMGSSYYTLTYVPENNKWDGKVRSIKVNATGQKLHLAYRTSYIALDQKVTANNQQTTPETERTQASTLAATMKRGAPTPTEILFKILVTASGVITPPADAQVPVGDGPLAKVSKKPQRRYRVDYAINPSDIQWSVQNGSRTGTMQVMVLGYDIDGGLVNQTVKTLPLTLSEANYAAAMRGGLQLSQELAMPAKGEYYLRVGVMDKTTNHIGSVEVSTSALSVPQG